MYDQRLENMRHNAREEAKTEHYFGHVFSESSRYVISAIEELRALGCLVSTSTINDPNFGYKKGITVFIHEDGPIYTIEKVYWESAYHTEIDVVSKMKKFVRDWMGL